MADGPKLSHTAAMILQSVAAGYIYGYTVMEVTGSPAERFTPPCAGWSATS
jgi:PadR family transcriptional regulator, regulatory protein PadR